MKKLLTMWITGLGMIIGIIYLTGCGQARWYPTDPRLESPSSGQPVVDETWRAGVVASVTNTAE
ncbi:MAG: hypothetical protein HGA76_04310 [Candidatus Firestonebacteria bacterium]|nr:hypothetical protein [Candidatus Firestonebacteria bacterium]